MADNDKSKTERTRASASASEAEEQAAPPPRAESDPPNERKYHRERLVTESAAFFGEESYVVAGALASESKQNFTMPEAKKLVSDFRKRPVSTD